MSITSSKTVQEVKVSRTIKNSLKLFSSDEENSSDNSSFGKSNVSNEAVIGQKGRLSGLLGKRKPKQHQSSTSKRKTFSKQKQRSVDQETGENTLSPPLDLSPNTHINFVFPRQIEGQASLPSVNSEQGGRSFAPSQDHPLLGSIDAYSRSGRAQPRGPFSQRHIYSNNNSAFNFRNRNECETVSERNEDYLESYEELDHLSGQDLANRHHLIWRQTPLSNQAPQQTFSQTGHPQNDLSYIAPSYSQS